MQEKIFSEIVVVERKNRDISKIDVNVVANRDMISQLLTSVNTSAILWMSSARTSVPEHLFKSKGVLCIANEIIFTELRAKSVQPARLAFVLGINEQTLMQVLRFELDEKEQIRLLFLIGEIAEEKLTE